jgi:putative ABC transport system permease protein
MAWFSLADRGMETALQDLKYAVRTLVRAPGFTVAAAFALALGIGGSSAMFSVLESVVLRPLQAPHPERLARLYEVSQSEHQGPWSPLDYLDLEKENGSFEAVAAVHTSRVAMTLPAGPVQLPAARVTGSFFAALGVHPALGRGLSPDEDKEGSAQAVVLTDGLWKREFNGDRRVLGQSVVLSGRSYTIVGVMPASFRFPLLRDAQLILPAGWTKDDLQTRGMHSWSVFGRLKPGASVASAQADLEVLGPRIASRLSDHTGQTLRTVPLHDDLVGPVKPVLEALLGAVILVLLIACANVASMLLARGAARQRELAIRAALGSGRMRIVRQLLTESVLLAFVGGGLGVLLAAWGVDALVALAPASIPRLDEVRLDGAVLAFALAVSLAAGVTAGLIPALQASSPDLVESLKSGAAAVTGRNRARSVLVVAEIALALVLVIGAGLMIRTLVRLLDVRTGMGADPARVFVAEINLPEDRYRDAASTLAFQQRLVDRVAMLPGVQSAAVTTGVPMDPNFQASLSFQIVGEPAARAGQEPDAEVLWQSPGALQTLGIPLVEGRPLQATDGPKATQVLLVNQAFVRKFLGGNGGVGRQLKRFLKDDEKDVWTVVGVFADVHTQRLDRLPAPQIVLPEAQSPQPYMRLLVRTGGSPLTLAPLVRTEVLALDKDLPLAKPQTLDRVIAESLGERRFQMTLLTVFGAIALLLASVGIYGVVAYSVAQRSKEIGIRMALGAQRSSVLRMVVGSGLRLALFGVGIGLIGAVAVTQALRRTLYQVSATDPLTFAAVAALLIAIALLASWAPARRAAHVDPMDALRAE